MGEVTHIEQPEFTERGLVETKEIEEFEYGEPWPKQGDPVPCDSCRGQGYHVMKERWSSFWRVEKCDKCNGTSEITFLCDKCGAYQIMKLNDGSEVIRHKAYCPRAEYCMAPIERSQAPCRRPIVERFEIYANGQMHGFCGIHARGKDDMEKMSRRRKTDEDLRDWRMSQREAEMRTMEERIQAVSLALDSEKELVTDTGYDREGRLTVFVRCPLPLLERVLGLEIVPQKALEIPPEIEDDDQPEPF